MKSAEIIFGFDDLVLPNVKVRRFPPFSWFNRIGVPGATPLVLARFLAHAATTWPWSFSDISEMILARFFFALAGVQG